MSGGTFSRPNSCSDRPATYALDPQRWTALVDQDEEAAAPVRAVIADSGGDRGDGQRGGDTDTRRGDSGDSGDNGRPPRARGEVDPSLTLPLPRPAPAADECRPGDRGETNGRMSAAVVVVGWCWAFPGGRAGAEDSRLSAGGRSVAVAVPPRASSPSTLRENIQSRVFRRQTPNVHVVQYDLTTF